MKRSRGGDVAAAFTRIFISLNPGRVTYGFD